MKEENVKMRRCLEDVKMRRCFTDPHYWKNPALRRSREKALIQGSLLLQGTSISLLGGTSPHLDVINGSLSTI